MILKDTIVYHDFREQLDFSHKASDLLLWEQTYRKAFPGFLACHDHREDGQHQRQGIDRSVILANGKQIFIDEKARGVNKKTGEVYEDIALEFLSDVDHQAPGWVCKPLLCDYINYAILPLGIAYLLPTLALQRTWREHGRRWLQYAERRHPQYKIINAYNKGWVTRSCCVPPEMLLECIKSTLIMSFEPVHANDLQ